MSISRTLEELREATRRRDLKKSGFGYGAGSTVRSFKVFVHPHELPERPLKNDDGSIYEPQNSDGSLKPIRGLDLPPI